MSMGWASIIMSQDAEERAVVTASMNAIGQGIMAGTQVVQYPATGAPNFHKGWSSNLGTAVAQLFVILSILYMSTKWDAKQKVVQNFTEEDSEGEKRETAQTPEGKEEPELLSR